MLGSKPMDDSNGHDRSIAEQWRRSQDGRARPDERTDAAGAADEAAPIRCPVCRSQDVSTTGKPGAVDAYWRCGGCGEVWNVGRHRAGARHYRDTPFRR
jgi:ribosomal protein L37AE/L43A